MNERVNTFDVLKAMSAENLDIRLAPLANVVKLHKVRGGTEVTIGVAGDVVAAIGVQGRFVGGLLLADRDQYEATAARLRAAEGKEP